MFNADLALSVTMTAASTVLSTLMLPTNLILYTRWTYSAAVVKSLDWTALFVSLAVVIGGIGSGLVTSQWANHMGNAELVHRRANRMGNLAGLCLILMSVSVSSSNHQAALWDQNAQFYTACALPPVIGLLLAVSLASYFQLAKPERVAVSIEASYQNTGIATTVALTMFQTEKELATAIGVPLYYGIVEALVIATFCIVSWKAGWTKAPADASLCNVLATSYEVERHEEEQEETAIEVILSEASETKCDMIFSQTEKGYYVVDENTLQSIKEAKKAAHAPNTNLTGDPTESNPTESSSNSDGDDASGEADGIVMMNASGVHIRGTCRHKRYNALECSSLPVSEEAAAKLDSAIPQDMSENATGRLGRTISTIRARATGYRHQKPLNAEDDERDNSLHTDRDTKLSVGVDDAERTPAFHELAGGEANATPVPIRGLRRKRYMVVQATSPNSPRMSDETVSTEKDERGDDRIGIDLPSSNECSLSATSETTRTTVSVPFGATRKRHETCTSPKLSPSIDTETCAPDAIDESDDISL
jgi:hypothetical protein